MENAGNTASKTRRAALHAFTACTLVLASGCASLSGVRLVSPEDAIVYQPAGGWEGEIETPGLVKHDVAIPTEDGLTLHGWYCPVEDPRAVVLFAHGNAGAVPGRWPRLRWLTERLGVSVLAFDYRGYGRSEGKPSEAGLIADARAARAKLAELAGTAEGEIVLYGRSLGGGVMTQLAADDGARGVILESTFTSLPELANYKLPLTPPGRIMRNRYDSLSALPRYQGPLLMAHGDADRLIPIEMGQQLYEAANQPKQFLAIPGASHNWTPTLEYTATVDQFLSALPPRGATSSD